MAPPPASGPACPAPVCWDALAQRAAWLARSPPHNPDSVGTTEALLLLHPPHSGHIQVRAPCLPLRMPFHNRHQPRGATRSRCLVLAPRSRQCGFRGGGTRSALSTDMKSQGGHIGGAQQPLAASPLSEPQTLDSKMREIIVTFRGL